MNAWPMDTPFSAADLTLQPAPVFPELYYPIWLYSGSGASSANYTTAGTYFVVKGTTSCSSTKSSATNLFTVPSGWNPSTKVSFESTIFPYNTSGAYTQYAQLWDMTSNTAVSNSQISSSTSTSVFRSSQFTLTPGHTYGITLWCSASGYYGGITDASLIVFPSSPLVSPSVSSISLAGGSSLKEAYIPLYMFSSSGVQGTSSATSAGAMFVPKGSGTAISGTSSSAVKLHTLSSNWPSSQKFAFEASIDISNASGTVNSSLWDITAGTQVSGSTVSTSSTTFTLVRSSSFTLTLGHTYGVTLWSSQATSYSIFLSKAHLVALAN